MQSQSLLMASSDPCHKGQPGHCSCHKGDILEKPDILSWGTQGIFQALPRYLCRVIFSLGDICRGTDGQKENRPTLHIFIINHHSPEHNLMLRLIHCFSFWLEFSSIKKILYKQLSAKKSNAFWWLDIFSRLISIWGSCIRKRLVWCRETMPAPNSQSWLELVTATTFKFQDSRVCEEGRWGIAWNVKNWIMLVSAPHQLPF